MLLGDVDKLGMAQGKTVRILLILLVIALVAAAAIVWLLPSKQTTPDIINDDDLVPVQSGPLFDEAATIPTDPIGVIAQPSTGTANAVFNLGIFERSSYNILNHQLINEGALPVQPPPTTGKANPFL